MKRRNHWSWRYDKPSEDYPLWRQVLALLLVAMVLGIVGLLVISLLLDAVK